MCGTTGIDPASAQRPQARAVQLAFLEPAPRSLASWRGEGDRFVRGVRGVV